MCVDGGEREGERCYDDDDITSKKISIYIYIYM